MRIREISVRNYKSLRHVTVRPRSLNVLVGPNDSGKSNFADFLDFLADVYQHGVSEAVARKGGADAIAFRDRDSRSGTISFSIDADISYRGIPHDEPGSEGKLRFRHEVSLKLIDGLLWSYHAVDEERLTIDSAERGSRTPLVALHRSADEIRSTVSSENSSFGREAETIPAILELISKAGGADRADSILNGLGSVSPMVKAFAESVSKVRVFQFSPVAGRQPGAPAPSSKLDRYGANLPTVVDLLQREHPRAWEKVLTAMRRIKPNLEQVEVGYTENRLLGLFFREAGYDRAWSAAEVSDGTIQSLALLTAIYDPEPGLLVLEEPENSVHPWIVRNIVEACRSVGRRKQIILTTHSPVLLDAVKPSEVWMIWRNGNGSSHVEPFGRVEPGFEESWRAGRLSISEFLDSGALPSYVPSGVRDSDPEADEDGEAD